MRSAGLHKLPGAWTSGDGPQERAAVGRRKERGHGWLCGKGHQVLLIDDDSEFCELMTDYLDVHSFAVSSVHTGTAGIEAARRQEYDVILLDMLLPDISGIEVLRHLRTETRAPVASCPPTTRRRTAIVTLELGADDYVPKTFSGAGTARPHPGCPAAAWKTPGFRKARTGRTVCSVCTGCA